MASIIHVGKHQLRWKTLPRSHEGSGELELDDGTRLSVSWKMDASGVWVTFPYGTYGYDIKLEADDDAQFEISRRRGQGSWSNVKLTRGGLHTDDFSKSQTKSKTIKVKAQMPGKIIRVFVKPGQLLQKGDSILVMEAMKMENEMKATEAGTLLEIKVKEGQAIETGIELYTIEPKK